MSAECKITLVQMERARPHSSSPELMKVVFNVRYGWTDFDVPVWINPEKVDQANLIKLAQHAFHGITSQLAEKASQWALDKDEFAAVLRNPS